MEIGGTSVVVQSLMSQISLCSMNFEDPSLEGIIAWLPTMLSSHEAVKYNSDLPNWMSLEGRAGIVYLRRSEASSFISPLVFLIRYSEPNISAAGPGTLLPLQRSLWCMIAGRP